MSMSDKARSKAEELKGQAKERYGAATNNERLKAEGSTEATKARAKQMGEQAKDTGRGMK